MTDMSGTGSGNRGLFAGLVLLLAFAGAAAGWLWYDRQAKAADPASAIAANDRAAIEKVVHDYILAHPEILPQAMENLQRSESARQLSGVRGDVEKAFPGVVLGNPQGSVTLVEFTDFACGFCRQSVGDVTALIAANPDLRIVIRELPILSPESAAAARMALAAGEQGKYAAFHHAMFAAGRPDAASIDAAAQAAGLDMARARRVAADPRIEAELARNMDLARKLGFNGTPSWIAGNELLSGAVGKDRLAEAIAATRGG
jgi:protein-disulfide isomerase